MNHFIEEKNEIFSIFKRIKNKDFSGNSGQAIKNSIYQFLTSIVSKAGSLVFTVILARLLLPELFGLYSLALSVILIFSTLSELGIGSAIVKYVSYGLGKGDENLAQSYLSYLKKIKLILILLSISLLGIFSHFIANVLYHKPIFLALIAGIFYITFLELGTLFDSIFQAYNNFKKLFYKEVLSQILRISLISVGIFLSLKYSLRGESTLMVVILCLSGAFFLGFLFLSLTNKNTHIKKFNLSLHKRYIVNKFILSASLVSFSGIFFTYIDRIMLGYFVESDFIGYYTAAVGLVGALIPIISFPATVLFPIFNRLKEKSLEIGFKKSIPISLIISIIVFFITIFSAYFIIPLLYGQAYYNSIEILKILSFLVLIIPLTSIYSAYFFSRGNPNVVNKLLLIATMSNIVLNYFLISTLLKLGQIYSLYGAAIATLISQTIYLIGLIICKRRCL